jgi:hypothetical protein
MSSSVLNKSSQDLAHSQREFDAYQPDLGTRESLEIILSSQKLLHKEPSIAGWDDGLLDSDESDDDGPNEFLITRQAFEGEELAGDDETSEQEVSAPKIETQTSQTKRSESSRSTARPMSANKSGRRISSEKVQKSGRQSSAISQANKSLSLSSEVSASRSNLPLSNNRLESSRPKLSLSNNRVGSSAEFKSRELSPRESETAHKIPPVVYTEEPHNFSCQIYEREVCGHCPSFNLTSD